MPKNPPTRSIAPLWAALAFGVVAALTARKTPEPDPASEIATGGRDGGGPEDAGRQTGSGAGRDAKTPSELPLRGWKDILWRVYEEFGNDRVLAVAASVTFYGLLAVFPAIVALVSLYGLFADPMTISDQLTSLAGVMPSGALEIIGDQVKRIASKPAGSLGFGFLVGLGVALWSANAGMKAMFDALNICYDEKEKRNFFVLNAVSLIFTLAAIVALVLALSAVVILPIVLKFVDLGGAAELLVRLARWPILLLVIVLGLATLFRFGPSRTKAKWAWVTWGSAFAAIGWVIASMLFSWYVSAFGSYNETYGSLGAAIGFMTWIWISTTIILVGAELNAEMEHQTAEDTTEGSHKPQGTRGAQMADQVAA